MRAAERSRRSALRGADVAIEFTRPDAVAAQHRAAHRRGLPAVTGTTGWDAELRGSCARWWRRGAAPLLHAANFSLGVHLFLRAARDLARRFAARRRLRRLYTGGASRGQARRAVGYRARAPARMLAKRTRRDLSPSRRSAPAACRVRTR